MLAIVLAVVGWRVYTDRQTTKASAALEEAMRVFQARIRTPGEPEEPAEITYLDAKNKFEDATRKFAQVAQDYPRTPPGQVARYYTGLSYERLARYDEAQKWLREAQSGSDEVAALARFQLAGVLAKAGKAEEAAKIYQQLMQKPPALVPKPVVMLALADHYRKTSPAEAFKLYEQVKKDFPDTPAAEEAAKRLEGLPKTW